MSVRITIDDKYVVCKRVNTYYLHSVENIPMGTVRFIAGSLFYSGSEFTTLALRLLGVTPTTSWYPVEADFDWDKFRSSL